MDLATEEVEGEMAGGASDSAAALLYEDDTGPDVYVSMETDLADAQLLPMPSRVPPPPVRSCERRQCKFHAAEGVYEHRLLGSGQRAATSLAGTVERFEFQPTGRVARECA